MDAKLIGPPEVLPEGVRLVRFKFYLQNNESESMHALGYSAQARFCTVALPPMGMVVRTFELNRSSNSQELEILVPLDPVTVAAIEEVRKDGDVPVNVSISLLLWRPQGARMESTGAGLYTELSARRWLDLLAKLGHGEVELVELRRPARPPHDRLDSAFAHLKVAEAQLRAGENENAVQRCRKAYEAAEAIFLRQDPSSKQMRFDSAFAAFIDRDSPGEEGELKKSARYEAMWKSLWKSLHMSAHDGYHISRPDAEVLVQTSITLMAFLSRRLREMEGT